MQPFEQLEKSWAEFNGLPPEGMVACASGSAALVLALEALKLPPGSEVICADYNMVACPRAISMAGLIPVFVDCRNDLNVNPELVKTAVGDVRPKAALFVHVYGRRAPLNGLVFPPNTAGCVNAFVIEDLAEAHGVRPHPETDAACWSFQSTKHVHGEEGGAVWFRDPAHAYTARELRNMGFGPTQDYVHRARAHNYRLANLLAAPILRSLDLYADNLKSRWAVYDAYDRLCPPAWRMPRPDAPWVYSLRVPGLTRARMTEAVGHLNTAGIAARNGFWPMSLQKEFQYCRVVKDVRDKKHGPWSYAEAAAAEVFLLPLAPTRVRTEDPDGWAARTFARLHEALPPAA